MDAWLVARRLGEAFDNLRAIQSVVDDVEELADAYDALATENASLREYVDRLERHVLANAPTNGLKETKARLNRMRRLCWLKEKW